MSRTALNKRTLTPESGKLSVSGKKAARELLLLTTSAGLSPEARENISLILNNKIDWQYLLDLAEYHGTGSLLAYNLLHNDFTGKIPAPYTEKLNTIYHRHLYTNIVFADQLSKILSAFSKNNIPVIVLKGVTLAELLYNNPGLRTVSDIDIMVPPEMIVNARSVLEELGYQPQRISDSWEHPFHEIPYFIQVQLPVFVELHRNLDNPGLVDIPLQEIWRRAQRVQIQGISSLLLSPEDMLLYLANCFSKPSNFTLKTLGDIAELIKKYYDSLDWNYILDSSRSWRVTIILGYALILARSLLGAPVPESATKTHKPGFWRNLLQQLLANQDIFISPVKWRKLRIETLVVRNSLMMDNPGRMLLVLSRFRGYPARAGWLRSTMWIISVLFAALVNKVIGLGNKSI
jgi:hypothetical protein